MKDNRVHIFKKAGEVKLHRYDEDGMFYIEVVFEGDNPLPDILASTVHRTVLEYEDELMRDNMYRLSDEPYISNMEAYILKTKNV